MRDTYHANPSPTIGKGRGKPIASPIKEKARQRLGKGGGKPLVLILH